MIQVDFPSRSRTKKSLRLDSATLVTMPFTLTNIASCELI